MWRTSTAVTLLVLLSAGCGGGSKPSTNTTTTNAVTSERSKVEAAITHFVAMAHGPAAKDNKIVSVSISTLDPSYAAARMSSKSAGPADIVLHESQGTWWVEQFGSSLGCDAAPKAVLQELKVGCSPPSASAWIDDCGPLVARPAALTLSCADGNVGLVRLSWSAWDSATATATGEVQENSCTPNCAAGKFKTYPVTIRVNNLTRCGKASYYARLAVTYTGPRPQGTKKTVLYSLGC